MSKIVVNSVTIYLFFKKILPSLKIILLYVSLDLKVRQVDNELVHGE